MGAPVALLTEELRLRDASWVHRVEDDSSLLVQAAVRLKALRTEKQKGQFVQRECVVCKTRREGRRATWPIGSEAQPILPLSHRLRPILADTLKTGSQLLKQIEGVELY